jgi:histidinol-phosphate aminotransferase
VAVETCLARGPVAAAQAEARRTAQERDRLEGGLLALGVDVEPRSQAPFLLCRVPGRPDVRERLREQGIAVRRGDTFPGLTGEHWRTAVKDAAATDALLGALGEVL